MKIWRIVARAWQAYRAHWSDLMQGLLLQLVVCLMALAPLLFLSKAETTPLALLSPVLFVLLVLPLRQNAALGLKRTLAGERFTTPALVSFDHYGGKLVSGLHTGLWLLVWALPCLAITVAFQLAYQGMVDAFTLMRFFMDLGGGKFTVGIVVALGVYALTLVLVLVGMAFCSWRRHGRAQGLSRKAAKEHRGKLMVVNLIGALTFVPFLAVVVIISHGYLSQLVAALSSFATGNVTLPPLTGNLWLIAAAFVVLFLPLAPLKALLPAAFAQALAEEKHHEA